MFPPQNRVFSGVQPTGQLHLGNYLGAIRNFVNLQASHECLYCVVDMHAITVWQNPDELRHNTYEVVAAFLAAGVDGEKHIVFNQSRVCAHAELAWILNCVARMGWLNRMTQFKEKAGKNRENASVGLYVYPNLMAADILSYQATHVPVGADQKQHLELARDIAQKFNHDFLGEDAAPFFPLPEPLIIEPAMRIMSLRDGSKKMSKSESSDMSRITLTDEADSIAQKIRKARTDAAPLPENEAGLKGRPEAANLVGIFAALCEQTPAQVLQNYAGQNFSVFKPDLADLMIEKIAPITTNMKQYLADKTYLDKVLDEGAARADALARPILDDVKKIVGFA